MKPKVINLLSLVLAANLGLVACQKSGESGAGKKLGSGRNDVKLGSKVADQEILTQSQETFKTCQSASLASLLNLDGFAKNTLTGKNLESALKALTNKSNLSSAVEELANSNKDLNTSIERRFSLVVELVNLNKDLSTKEKFLLSENIFEMAFPFEDHVLSADEANDWAKRAEKNNGKVFDNEKWIDELMTLVEALKASGANSAATDTNKKAIVEKTQSFVKDQTAKLDAKKSRIKAIADRIAKKDKTLKAEYNTLSKELVVLGGVMEMKACSQMAIEKSEMKGDLVAAFVQATKSRIELEAVNGTKP